MSGPLKVSITPLVILVVTDKEERFSSIIFVRGGQTNISKEKLEKEDIYTFYRDNRDSLNGLM